MIKVERVGAKYAGYVNAKYTLRGLKKRFFRKLNKKKNKLSKYSSKF